jgi:hypothetical protein
MKFFEELDAVRRQVAESKGSAEAVAIIKSQYYPYKERLKKYYRDDPADKNIISFKDLVLTYLRDIYFMDKIIRAKKYGIEFVFDEDSDISKIEFGFAPMNPKNFTGLFMKKKRHRKTGETYYDYSKPPITDRPRFFSTIKDFFTYCEEATPLDIFVGSIWEKGTAAPDDTMMSRPLCFDFDDYVDWRNGLINALCSIFYITYVYNIGQYKMYFTGGKGVHLYPYKEKVDSFIVFLAEHDTDPDRPIRAYFVNNLMNIGEYAEVIAQPFILAQDVMEIENRIKNSIKDNIDYISVDYELLTDIDDYKIFAKKQQALQEELSKITDEKKRLEFLEYMRKQMNLVLPKFDVPVSIDMRRLIRLPGSIHSFSSNIVVPIVINEEHTIKEVAEVLRIRKAKF